MKNLIGIWLDYKEAVIIEIKGNNTETKRVDSEIEFNHMGGGARSKTPWGPMDKTSERKHLDRRTHQTEDYYKRIMDEISHADEVFVFGPAEAKIGLRKIIESNKSGTPKIRGFESADSMTENQKIAKVRDFFKISI